MPGQQAAQALLALYLVFCIAFLQNGEAPPLVWWAFQLAFSGAFLIAIFG